MAWVFYSFLIISISNISIYITSASFYLMASSSSMICLSISSLAASCFCRLNSSTLERWILSYYFCILFFISFSWAYWERCWWWRYLFYYPMNLACFASSFLCRMMASAIFFFSPSLSLFYLKIFSLAAWLTWWSCCILAILEWAFYSLLTFNFVTSWALFLVSSIFFQVLNSSYLSRAILFASNCASLSILTFKKQLSEKFDDDFTYSFLSFAALKTDLGGCYMEAKDPCLLTPPLLLTAPRLAPLLLLISGSLTSLILN